MSVFDESTLRRTVRGIAVSSTRSCTLQSSGKHITTAPATRVPFHPDSARKERAAIWIKSTVTPLGVPVAPIFVQGTRLPGGALPAGPATLVSYPIRQLTANTLQSRRINRMHLPFTGKPPLFVAIETTAGTGTIEIE